MAIKSTIIKINLHIVDMNRYDYQDHALTMAQHPSETDERIKKMPVTWTINTLH